MEETFELALTVSIGTFGVILLVSLIVLVCTYHTGVYKSFGKPVKTMGVIEQTRYIDVPDEGKNFYLITYSFTDNAGIRYSATFRWLQNVGGAGDKIAVHYDSLDPQKSIADCQLKYGKNLWWKVLIILAVLIVPAVFIVIFFGE